MRHPHAIRAELDELSVRRSEVWQSLALSHDPRGAAEIRGLDRRIEELWLELRETSVRIRFGPAERIIATARRDIKLERELITRRRVGYRNDRY